MGFFMQVHKEYSCVKKTKRNFEKSLVALAKEKPLNKINVKQLCEEAGLSRNAFYFHYDDINALIDEIRENALGEIASLLGACREQGFPENMLTVIENLTEYFVVHGETVLMLTDFSPEFIDKLNSLYSDFYFEYYSAYHKTKSRELYDMFYSYASCGFTGMLRHWLHNREKIPKQVFVRLAYSFTKRLVFVGDVKLERIKLDRP